jgi:hypothetical protein
MNPEANSEKDEGELVRFWLILLGYEVSKENTQLRSKSSTR